MLVNKVGSIESSTRRAIHEMVQRLLPGAALRVSQIAVSVDGSKKGVLEVG